MAWFSCPEERIKYCSVPQGLVTPVSECCPSVWWWQRQKDVWSQKRVLTLVCLSIPFLQSSMPTPQAILPMVYASLCSNFCFQPSSSWL